MAAPKQPKAAGITEVSEGPAPTRSTVEKLKAAETSQILGPDATLMRDLKGKHMIGGGHRLPRGKR